MSTPNHDKDKKKPAQVQNQQNTAPQPRKKTFAELFTSRPTWEDRGNTGDLHPMAG